MDQVLLSTEYILVIDTDYFSYDFANDLVAYCTGITDNDENGIACANLFYSDCEINDDGPKGLVAEEKNQFFDYVTQRVEGDYSTPCCVWLNKKYGCTEEGDFAVLTEQNCEKYSSPAPFSVGIFFDVEPTSEIIEIVKERSLKFFDKIYTELDKNNKSVRVEGFRLIIQTRYGKEISL